MNERMRYDELQLCKAQGSWRESCAEITYADVRG
jgi:hypothetical protein